MRNAFGAGDRGRTGTVSPPPDFESGTSANSITPAILLNYYTIIKPDLSSDFSYIFYKCISPCLTFYSISDIIKVQRKNYNKNRTLSRIEHQVKKMNVVIIGNGKMGSTLCDLLVEEGHDITVVDNKPAALKKVIDRQDIMCVEGNGATVAVQEDAGVNKAGLVIASTPSDELNMLCCLIAKKLGAKRTISRVRNPEYFGQINLIKRPGTFNGTQSRNVHRRRDTPLACIPCGG